MNEWMNERKSEWMNVLSGQMDKWVEEWMGEWMDGWTNWWMDRWKVYLSSTKVYQWNNQIWIMLWTESYKPFDPDTTNRVKGLSIEIWMTSNKFMTKEVISKVSTKRLLTDYLKMLHQAIRASTSYTNFIVFNKENPERSCVPDNNIESLKWLEF